VDHWERAALGKSPGHIYSRNTNPTVGAFEEKVRQLEGAEAATSFSTGMAAITNTLFTLLSPGDRLVSIKDSYGGTNKLFLEFLPRFAIEVDLCDTTDHIFLERSIARGCRVLYLETPTNPTLKVVDIGRLSKAAHAVGAIVVVDNTFATPLNQNPLALGVDLVLHSATKFLGGHADALGGVVCGRADLVRQIYHHREITGAALHPMAAYFLLRGMKTLHLRIRQHVANARAIAAFLKTHPAVDKVNYPGFGGIVSFSLREDTVETATTFVTSTLLFKLAESLGGPKSLVSHPAQMTHKTIPVERRRESGVVDSLIRLSAGLEDAEDLIADLTQALNKVWEIKNEHHIQVA